MIYLTEGSPLEMKFITQTLTHRLAHFGQIVQKCFVAWIKPAKSSLVAGTVGDLSNLMPS
jgi:hypothetical protein